MAEPEDAPNTLVSYMYRDASNYKQESEVVFVGRPTGEELAAAAANLEDGQFFIPSQVGLEDLQENWGTALYDDDHVWHELDVERDFQPTHRLATEEGDIHAFLGRVATTAWDEFAAMREHGLDIKQQQESYAALPPEAMKVANRVIRALTAAPEECTPEEYRAVASVAALEEGE